MNSPPPALARHQTLIAAGRLLLGTAVFAAPSPAARLFYDPFDYLVGEELGEGSSAASWENDKSNITVAGGSLDYPGLALSTGQRVKVDGGASNLDGVRTAANTWEPQTNGALYVSFLLRLDSAEGIAAGGTGTPILNISQAGSSSKQLISVNLLNSGGIRAGVLKYPSGSTPVSSAFFASGPGADLAPDGAATYLVVARYRWVDGDANDEVALWINPTGLGETEDPANRLAAAAGADGSGNAGRLYINRGPCLNIDELRIGQSWADVTPPDGPVAIRRPHITESLLATNAVILRGTNGPPAGVYQLMHADAIPPLADTWTPVATNAFDAAGNFETTRPLPPDASRAFFCHVLGGSLPTAPAITTQPADRTVLAGQDAPFLVAATGTEPLGYQWFLDGQTIPGATGAIYTVSNAQAGDAGGYHAVVANVLGTATSTVATLTVVGDPAAGIPDGYATLDTGTTGGAGGPTVIVDTRDALESQIGSDSPGVVLVQGIINLGSSNVRVRDNKTLIGLGADATLLGNLKVYGNNNVIIRNLTFTNPTGVGDGDGLTLHDCRNVWVDHCTFVDCDDGTADIGHGADWITVSWCRFHYTNPANDHRFSNLVGHSDNNAAEDAGRLHVTFHHNWWSDLVHERMPRVRFGRVHLYNNYYHSPGNNYCIRAAIASEILVEHNYFDSVKNVWELYRTEGLDGRVFAAGNFETNTTWVAGDDSHSVWIPGTDILSAEPNGLNPVPYAFTPDPVPEVPGRVSALAGAGKGPFAP